MRDVVVVETSVGGAVVIAIDLVLETPPLACTETLSEPAAVKRLAGSVTCAEVSVDALVANVCVPVAPDTTTATGGLKLLPVRVNVLAVLSATTDAGATLVSSGMGNNTVNTSDAEVPPAGAGFSTRTLLVPGVVSNAAGIVAVSVPDDGARLVV